MPKKDEKSPFFVKKVQKRYLQTAKNVIESKYNQLNCERDNHMEKQLNQLKAIRKQVRELENSLFEECPRAFEMTTKQFDEFERMTNSLNKVMFYLHHATACVERYEEASKEAK